MSQSSQNLLAIVPEGLARASVEFYIRERTVFPAPELLPDYLNLRAGAFVSIKTLDGRLRGCIGSIEPIYQNVAIEIIQNAIKAATADHRFEPVCPTELDILIYSVDILTSPEPISNLEGHDPKIHGLIIETETCRGVLLPDLEGIDTAEIQLSALKRKIGLPAALPVRMSRFFVKRYGRK